MVPRSAIWSAFALDERAPDAGLSERDGERESDRARAHHDDFSFDGAHGAVIIISACDGSSQRSL